MDTEKLATEEHFDSTKCSFCKKEPDIKYLDSEEYGMDWEEDDPFAIPEGWYLQTGGDYCGGRWMHFFCSLECAKNEKNRYVKK